MYRRVAPQTVLGPVSDARGPRAVPSSLYWDTESLDTARLRRLHGVVVDGRDVREKYLLAAPRGREVGVGVGAGGRGRGRGEGEGEGEAAAVAEAEVW